jgi:hypothetical protein
MIWQKMTRKEFKDITDRIRSVLPTNFPVVFRRIKLPIGMRGDCVLLGKKKKYFLIRLNKDLERCAMEETILHEYAHALSWSELHPYTNAHDAHFGIEYSRVYQELVEL